MTQPAVHRRFWISFGMAVLLVACVFAFNSAAFDFWMCAHPNEAADIADWRHRFYIWFAVTLFLGGGWLFLLILLLVRRRGESVPGGG